MSYKRTAYAVLAVCGILTFTPGIRGEEITEYQMTLDPDDRYNVTWSFSGHGPDDDITFTVSLLLLRQFFLPLIVKFCYVGCFSSKIWRINSE